MKRNLYIPGISSLAAMIAGMSFPLPHKGPPPQPTKVRSGRPADEYRGPKRPGHKEMRRRRPFNFQPRSTPSQEPDLRHDKYLHSHARRLRRRLWEEQNGGREYPYDKANYFHVQRA